MLTAIEKDTDILVFPAENIDEYNFALNNKNSFICPHCKKRVVFVDPQTKMIKHFRHYIKSSCDSEPETKNHLEMKKFLLKKLYLKKENLEVSLGFARPDIYIPEKKIAIELQNSPLSLKKFKERIENYNKNNIYVLWVFNYRLIRGNKPPAFIKEAHKIFLGRVYVYVPPSNEFEAHIKPVHFYPTGRMVSFPEFDDYGNITNYYGQEFFKYYKKQKNLCDGEDINNFSILTILNPYNQIKIARFYDKKFWGNNNRWLKSEY